MFETDQKGSRPRSRFPMEDCKVSATSLLTILTILLIAGPLMVGGPLAGYHAGLLIPLGLLMIFYPPQVSLPKSWWILAISLSALGILGFLPRQWFYEPPWREGLENLGLYTGNLVVIQVQHAAESLGLMVITLFVGLWIMGQRTSPRQLRILALSFTVGVACYAILARVSQEVGTTSGVYGFFPNRNHTGTYLAMGAVCGLGNLVQALRDRRFFSAQITAISIALILWAAAGWSISRGGIVLILTGTVIWLALVGPGYLGRNGRRALALIALTAVGIFFIVDSTVKDRLEKTVIATAEISKLDGGEKSETDKTQQPIDFRIPTALDTFDLIRDFKWTGVGAGQFPFIFPQYRNLTAIANDSETFHPESDWLWTAAELGIPATILLVGWIIFAGFRSARSIRIDRDRALRGGCLVAAFLIPLHGLFDVPGHRIILTLTAAFLFMLSLRESNAEVVPRVPPVWPSRVMGLFVLLAGLFLAWAQWFKGTQPAVVASSSVSALAVQRYQQDLLKNGSDGIRTEPPFADGEDPLEQSLAGLRAAGKKVPLDRRVKHLQGFLGLHFEGYETEAEQAFALEGALDPTWVKSPLRQASAWSRIDPSMTGLLWKEAILRADWMDKHHPGSMWGRDRTIIQIKAEAASSPELVRQVSLLLD